MNGACIPAISIVLPTFNRGHMLSMAIDNACSQSFSDWELIIVDDGSSDNTQAVVRAYLGDHRIKYFYKENRGVAAARNLGIEKARGTYLAFLDDDDLWIDGHLERSTAWLDKRPSHGFVYAPVILKNPSQNIERKHPEVVPVPTLENLFLSCTVQLPSVVARVSHVRAAGRFDESLRTGSDYDLWLRLAARAPFGVIDKISCIIHRHPGNITDSALRMYRGCLVVLQKRVDDLRSEISQTVIKQRMGRVSYLISRLAVGERNFKLAASSFFRALCFYPHIPGILYVLTLGRVPFGDNE